MSYYLIMGIAYSTYMHFKTLEELKLKKVYKDVYKANRRAMFLYRVIAWPVDLLQGLLK